MLAGLPSLATSSFVMLSPIVEVGPDVTALFQVTQDSHCNPSLSLQANGRPGSHHASRAGPAAITCTRTKGRALSADAARG
jgi:hypothetical protein